MEPRLYVGNLPYDTTEEDLRQIFSEAGPVASASIIMDRETGRSKGFAFVEMTNQADAEKAVSLLNGRELRRRQIRVDLARPRADRSPASGGGMNRDRRGSGGTSRGPRY